MKNHALDLRNRAALFGSLEGQVFDVVVIGGGITGAGIARDDTTSRIAYDPAFLEVDVLVFDTPKGYEDKLNALQAQLEKTNAEVR